jgi:hypothetical protein
MKGSLIKIMGVLIAIISPIFVQAADFSGVSIAIGGGAEVFSVAQGFTGPPGQYSGSQYLNAGDTSPLLNIDISYSKRFNEKWLLALGVLRDLNNQKAGSNVYASNNSNAYNAYFLRARDHYSLYVQPTYLLDNETAVFAKLGYHSTKLSLQDINGEQFNSSNVDAIKLNGIGCGIGAKKFIYEHLYLQAESEFVAYFEKVRATDVGNVTAYSNKMRSAAATLSVGYQF